MLEKRPISMMDLDELKIATGWNDVFMGTDCPVIRFNLGDGKLINGLRQNDSTFYLDYPEYLREPLSFMVSYGDEVTQYWVVGQTLHRNNAPAVVRYCATDRTTVTEFYHRGLNHNTNGPAIVKYVNHRISDVHPTTGEAINDRFVIDQWDQMTGYWYTDGIRSKYPHPYSMLCENGHRIFRVNGTQTELCDFNNSPALYAEILQGNWNHEINVKENDNFRLRSLKASGYYRHFTDGVSTKQGAASIDSMKWIINGEPMDSDADKRKRINDTLFREWNIWEGPLFPNEMETIYAVTEVTG